MLKRLRQLLDRERSGDEHGDQRRLILTFLSIALATLLVSAPVAIQELGTVVYLAFVGFALAFVVLVYMHQLWLAKAIIPYVFFVMVTRFVFDGGIHHHLLGGYYFIVIIEGLMNGQRALLRFGLMSTTAVVAIGVAEINGWITTGSGPLTEPRTVAITAFFLLGTTVALNALVVRLNRAASGAQRNEAAQIKANENLRELQAVLEERVRRRTADLDDSNRQLTTQLAHVNRLQERLRHEAIHDSLTGLYNRRFFDEALPLELARLEREHRPLTVLMLDIDRFKEINDTYGHQVGDAILRSVGQALKANVRAGDVVCRYGGEEFVLILPGLNAEHGRRRAEESRVMIASNPIRGGDPSILLTISVGGSVFPRDGTSGDDLISAADRALYRAKQNGRNRVEFAEPDDPEPEVEGAVG